MNNTLKSLRLLADEITYRNMGGDATLLWHSTIEETQQQQALRLFFNSLSALSSFAPKVKKKL